MLPNFPVSEAIPDLKQALAHGQNVVLEAPPGAGKTTIVPLALLDEPWAAGKKILMLEPRRIAARAAAARMASLRGEQPGETIGYHVRNDKRESSKTRVLILTEALLTRKIQEDPELSDVALIIFDEFHERSLHADLSLALTLECQAAFNEALKILIMSATLDGEQIARFLQNATVTRSHGKLYPVETRYFPPTANTRLDQNASNAIQHALENTTGGILVFLPGEAEIKSVARLLEQNVDDSVAVFPLFGTMPLEQQVAAIQPLADGRRKVVLSTSIAETSLTIEDVRTVIDAGLQRIAKYDPASGMTSLVTTRVSQASANQRRGRAGRIAEGTCYRLWDEYETRTLPQFNTPEILSSDLAPLALELSAWGEPLPSKLRFLDQPPTGAYAQAQKLLQNLDVIDNNYRITAHGKACLRFGAHPRLSNMMIKSKALGCAASAVALAAILGDRDILRSRDTDLSLRLQALSSAHHSNIDRAALSRVKQQAKIWARTLGCDDRDVSPAHTGKLVALAYPDRLAKRRSPASYRMANGRGAILNQIDPLASQDFLAIANVVGAEANAKIHQAAPISLSEIEALFETHIKESDDVVWNERERCVHARRERKLDQLVLTSKPIQNPDPEKATSAVISGIRANGLSSLPWTEELNALKARILLLQRKTMASDWPAFDDQSLLESLQDWLAPFLDGITRIDHFSRIDLKSALESKLTWEQRKSLERLTPTHMSVPSGSNIRVDYSTEEPFLAVRLQELFGLTETPSILDGSLPLTLHLLSPARRPVQVTRDLKSFWQTGYAEVKRDLKGRYPKHYWPDDPWTAVPTARAKPRNQ